MIEYTKGTPAQMGVYAVRVVRTDPDGPIGTSYEDKFLTFLPKNKIWMYPMEAARFRGDVIDWIGPLQRGTL